MDYKHKYTKYKTKYLQIKNNISGGTITYKNKKIELDKPILDNQLKNESNIKITITGFNDVEEEEKEEYKNLWKIKNFVRDKDDFLSEIY